MQPRGRFFFHTAFGPGQWIRVDLGRRRQVRRIEVTNRRGGYQERARHVFAVLSDREPGGRRVFPMYEHGQLSDGAWQECGIDLPDVGARYVTITSPMDTALHFADLRVYAAAATRRTQPTGMDGPAGAPGREAPHPAAAPEPIGATVALLFGAQRRHSTCTPPGRARMKTLGGSARSDVVAAKDPTEPTMTGQSDIR